MSMPHDREQRARIETALDETMFVEAGAGTGKTSALVSRLVALLTSGRASIDGIAAITFTEAAAAELRCRIREELEKHAISPHATAEEQERSRNALQTIENGSVQTLHSFAATLLRERPLEAGLPPNFDIVEEIEADIAFQQRWLEWLDQVLESETVARHLRTALSLGLRLKDLMNVARQFHANYDLLPDAFPTADDPHRMAAERIGRAAAEIRQLLPLAKNGLSDTLAQHASRVADLGERLLAEGPDTDASQLLLARWGTLSHSKGRKEDWYANPATGTNACTQLKEILTGLEGRRTDEIEAVRRAALTPLLESLRAFALAGVEQRRNAGKAEFHDLLVWARDLLRRNPAVRDHFQQRFSHILIDEFQDTDPIQAEIAFFLCDRPSGRSAAELRDAEWRSIEPPPGKLFVVGDPKQSIYRFRRADIASLEEVRSLMGGSAIPLSQNFRSQQTIIEWVNGVFAGWMGEGSPGIQAPHRDLDAWWVSPVAEPPLGVHWFGEQHEERATQLRQHEAEAVALAIRQIESLPWLVRDDSNSSLRPAEHRDVCILIPTRTNLQALERALEAAGVPYRVESQSLVFATEDIRELLCCLRAIDAPADQVALVGALRSSAFACSDVDLLRFVDGGGHLDYTEPTDDKGPVGQAFDALHRYHHARTWTPLDELVERFIRERRIAELSFGRKRPRERLRRLNFVLERARAFSRVRGDSLRAFLDWIERQASENARMIETPAPETDEDAVRIMTVHASKGLEFPIVILAGLGSPSRHTASSVIFDRMTRGVEVRIGAQYGLAFATDGYDAAAQREKEAEQAEDVRLAYVACTRARDHLLVSLFRGQRSGQSHAATISALASKRPQLWHELTMDRGITTLREASPPSTPYAGPRDAASRSYWYKKREALLAASSRPAAVAATAVAETAKHEVEQGDVFYRRGRGGSRLGRAVHSVLQTIDLATAAGLNELCRAQAAAEGIADRWSEVAALVQTGLESPVVKRAVASGHYYREVFVAVPLQHGIVEGYVDLLFQEHDGVVIADYKTDLVEREGPLEEAPARYALQAGTYALAVSKATGKDIKEVVLIFLRPGRDLSIPDVPSLIEQAASRAEQMLTASPGQTT